MDNLTTIPTRFIGCDVGKTQIVVFDCVTERTVSIANETEALAAFAASLDDASLVICEATGGYERPLLDALVAAGRAAHRADARKVKAFIRSFGTLGKSDAIDANGLALYGKERHERLARWATREEARDQLQILVATRRQLVEQRVACSNRLQAPGVAPVQDRLRRILDTLEHEIAGMETDIEKLIQAHETLARTSKTLRSISGIGPATATMLLAMMPELGTIGRRQAAALAGVAPHPRQSGNLDAYRRTRGGRPEIKRTLFMASLSAARYHPVLRSFYQRLCASGKKPLVALTAVMRKLIVIANAKVRDDLISQLS